MSPDQKQNTAKCWEKLAQQQLSLLRQLAILEKDHDRQLLIKEIIRLSEIAIEEQIYETESGRKRLAKIGLTLLHIGEHAHFLLAILQHLL